MDRERIEEWLQLPVLNVALAAIGKKDGDLRAATVALYDRVGELVKQAQREAVSAERGMPLDELESA